MWGLLKQGYGKLIQNYCSLLVNKMDFHFKNPQFPGNLILNGKDQSIIDENNDVEMLFQLCCEIYDYMDEILCLQTSVFGSLDMSRSNSMTSAGQCRLAPLIMCIQDSSQLYDFTVKILFKLHLALPHQTLDGHRNRFSNQFKLLSSFYHNSSNLQYFKTLIQIPKLPDSPPNFFIQSNLKDHVTPIVIIPNQFCESIEANLLDLNFDDQSDSDRIDDAFSWSQSTNQDDQKENEIQNLKQRINQLEEELQTNKIESEKKILELNEIAAANLKSSESSKDVDELRLRLEEQKATVVKLKDFYNKFRTEHIQLLKTKSESDKSMAMARKSIDELLNKKESLEKQLKEIKSHHNQIQEDENYCRTKMATLQSDYDELAEKHRLLTEQTLRFEERIAQLQNHLNTTTSNLNEEQTKSSKKIFDVSKQFLGILMNKSCMIVEKLVKEDLDLVFLSINCSPQYFSSQIQILIAKFEDLEKIILADSHALFTDNAETLLLFEMALVYYFQFFYMIDCSKTVIKCCADIELSQELSKKCLDLVVENENLANYIAKIDTLAIENSINLIKKILWEIYSLMQIILPNSIARSNQDDDLETLLNKEMELMDNTIQDAVMRIEQIMMTNASNDQFESSIKLEVNEKILTACTALMQAIKRLILDSKNLQFEIASNHKGNFSIKEFYQRNHRWTEGLISAAKTIAADANFLVETADKIVSGLGKFEELMAASQEISASCAQLVVASRVKADSNSENLSNLSKSSKSVLEETGKIIATTKQCSKLIEENVINDFSKLSLHQAKRLEMECQVKVLELENHLDKERLRLASIRRAHYHLSESLCNDENNSIH
ncbi:phosphatidylinositol 4 kinase [Sarcoptes scabiei]|nr:phosphatidylinositol 4 kinase [Sarcoptes scabiei]